ECPRLRRNRTRRRSGCWADTAWDLLAEKRAIFPPMPRTGAVRQGETRRGNAPFRPVSLRSPSGGVGEGACPSCLKLRFFLPMVELSWYAEPYLFSPSKELSGMPKLRILAPSLLALLL